jgi:transposase-like protein
MGTKKVILQSKRFYSEEFKKARVHDYETGELTTGEICSLYKIAPVNIYRWIYKYSVYNKKKVRVVEMSDSSTKKVKELQNKIKEMERIIGQKQMNIDYLEKMIELAKEHFDIDIKKNFSTPQSTGSDGIEE